MSGRNKKLRSVAGTLGLLFLLASLFACGPRSGSPQASDHKETDSSFSVSDDLHSDKLGSVKADRPYTIGLVAVSDNFAEQIIKSMQQECELHRAKLLRSYAESGEDEQTGQVKSLVEQGVDALIVIISDKTVAHDLLAAAGQTPLVFVNRKPLITDAARDDFVYVGSDEKDAGRLQAEFLQQYAVRHQLKEIRYFYLQGNTALSNSRLRHEYFIRNIKNGPVPVVSLGLEEADWSRSKAQTVTQVFLSRNASCNAIVCGNDEMALGAIDALKASRQGAVNEVAVLGIDGSETAKKAIANGELDFTVYQNATAQGASAVRAAVLSANQKAVPRAIAIPFQGLSLDNLYEN